MTPSYGICSKEHPIDLNIFRQSATIAINHNAQNVLITGKGESTKYPSQVTQVLIELKNYSFDKIELQTEGSNIAQDKMNEWLKVWKMLGLNYIAISVYDCNPKQNAEMFQGKEYNLMHLINKLQKFGFRVRLSCIPAKGYIDDVNDILKMIAFAKHNNVVQLTFRFMDKPKSSRCEKTLKNVEKYSLSEDDKEQIIRYIRKDGCFCDRLPHGAEIYEIIGQNVCITPGLSNSAGKDDIRYLIYFPQAGTDTDILTTSWETVSGSRIL